MTFDWVVIGAGFTGATFARVMAERGAHILVVDHRQHVGGNCYDQHDEAGILVHKYGPHVFHTNDADVWTFLSRFTAWRPYMHRVLALVDGQWVPIPFNLRSLEQVLPAGLASEVVDKLVRAYGYGARVPILTLRQNEDAQLQFLAEYVYDRVFNHYTKKQWGVGPEELDSSVTARVPVLVSRDDRYFQDTFQAMPGQGYTALFQRMLDHQHIKLLLNVHHTELPHELSSKRTLFTGRMDEYFGARLGALPYRSIRFAFEWLKQDQFQTVATHNYPKDYAFTRITEAKRLSGQAAAGGTTICLEYPQAWVPGENEPYYPIPRADNRALYERYVSMAREEAPHVVFAGRLGDYQYYNMDQAVARAIALAKSVREA